MPASIVNPAKLKYRKTPRHCPYGHRAEAPFHHHVRVWGVNAGCGSLSGVIRAKVGAYVAPHQCRGGSWIQHGTQVPFAIPVNGALGIKPAFRRVKHNSRQYTLKLAHPGE